MPDTHCGANRHVQHHATIFTIATRPKKLSSLAQGLPRTAFQRAPGTKDLNPALLSRTKLACVDDPSPLPICENFSGMTAADYRQQH